MVTEVILACNISLCLHQNLTRQSNLFSNALLFSVPHPTVQEDAEQGAQPLLRIQQVGQPDLGVHLHHLPR